MEDHSYLPWSPSQSRRFNQSRDYDELLHMFQNLWSHSHNTVPAHGTDLPINSTNFDSSSEAALVQNSEIGLLGLTQIPSAEHEIMRNRQFQGTSTAPMPCNIRGRGNSVNNTFTYPVGDSPILSTGYDLGGPENRVSSGNDYFFGNQTNPFDRNRITGRTSPVPMTPNSFRPMNSTMERNNLNSTRFLNYRGFTRIESNGSIEEEVSSNRFLAYKLMDLGGWSNEKVYKLLLGDLSLFDELQGNDIVMMAENQIGSQFLQRILVERYPSSTEKIIDGIIHYIFVIMCDKIGNYFFQKLLEFCNYTDITRIVCKLTTQDGLYVVAVDQYGTCSVQKLIKRLKTLDQKFIPYVMESLVPGLKCLMKSKTGFHLIEYCLYHLDHRQNEYIYIVAIKNCIELATHEQGCITLNNVIKTISSPHREELLMEISNNSLFLSKDAYGNYVVQSVLDIKNPYITEIICKNLKGNFVQLSTQKHGSHVVEKCLTYMGMEFVVVDLLFSEKLDHLAGHPYGNYVIQTALMITKRERYDLYNQLVKALIPHLRTFQNCPNGRNVFNLINKDNPISII